MTTRSSPDFAALGAAGPRLAALYADAAAPFHGVIPAIDAQAMAQQLGWTIDQLAVGLVPFAQPYANVPVSNYQVGAVVVGSSGALYYGANLEIYGEALSFTLHAEQAAIANAWMNGETGASAIAISAAPCGYCRQFLYELVTAKTLTVAMPGSQPALLTTFLPQAFGPGDLGKTGGLMQPTANGLTLPPSDAVTAAALAAANMAYSPYTATYAGIALQSRSGRIVSGAYAENAAFNPSLSPLEIALSQMTLCNERFSDIAAAVLVEPKDAPASQDAATRAVLAAVSRVPLTTSHV
jgi:cytidine deaminase